MKINSIKLSNFKNLKDKKFTFGQRTIVIAPNGFGKSNLLESIYILSSAKCERVGIEKDAICQDIEVSEGVNPFARIEGEVANGKKTNLTYFIEDRGTTRVGKELRSNGKKLNRAKFIEEFQTIFFDPETLNLINETPSKRRRFLDRFLSNFDQEYFIALLEHQKTLKNRNKLLSQIKEGLASKNEIEFWDLSMAKSASQIFQKRDEIINDINFYFETTDSIIRKKDAKLQIQYNSQIELGDKTIDEIKTKCLEMLNDNLEKDIIIGSTTIGPHRDDFVVLMNENSLQVFASRGEQRLAILSMLFSLSEIIHERIEKYPVLLLDDILSELDDKHKTLLIERIRTLSNQVIITSTDLDHFPKELIKDFDIIKLQ